jgi:Restriction Enzyme Adenine Methylase Associated
MPHRIEVDDEVFALLQQHARPFLDTPNSTVRRLIGLDAPVRSADSADDDSDLELLLQDSQESSRTKAPKASLPKLVQHGLLQAGERLFLVDYKGNRVPQQEATVSGSGLLHKGHHYSMSDLSQALLRKQGFVSRSVRGPLHWQNSKGESVAELWQRLLAK